MQLHKDKPDSRAADTVADILFVLNRWAAVATAGAELRFDHLVVASEQQRKFFRAQVHNECKRLGICSETQGRVDDPEHPADADGPAALVGGYAVAINRPRAV